jgi:hypothetical protein
MTTTTYGFGIRERPQAWGRALPSPLPDRIAEMVATAEKGAAEPFIGLTADARVQPGLFELKKTNITTRPIRQALDGYVALLTEEQRWAGVAPMESDLWRKWYNIHPFIVRHGLRLEDLSQSQREAAYGLLAMSLSAAGFEQARDIMRLNYHIGEVTEKWEEYGELLYWLTVFVAPDSGEVYGWQIDGHHLNLNFVVVGDQVVMTPAFMGSEPVYAEWGKYAGTRVFDAEEQHGLELVRSLGEAQQAKAILFPSTRSTDLPPERWHPTEGRIQARAFRDNLVLPYEGLAADQMSAPQLDKLRRLIETYVSRIRPEHAALRMQEVEAHLNETHLVWMGGTSDDDVFYYRVQSPVILIEFDHLRGIAFDNDEPSRLHVHTVVRTPNGNDYGKDLLRQHYERFHTPGTDQDRGTPSA